MRHDTICLQTGFKTSFCALQLVTDLRKRDKYVFLKYGSVFKCRRLFTSSFDSLESPRATAMQHPFSPVSTKFLFWSFVGTIQRCTDLHILCFYVRYSLGLMETFRLHFVHFMANINIF